MAYSTEKNRITPIAIVAGLTLAFTIMGVASATLGSVFFDYKDYIQMISGLIIVFMGLYLLLEVVENAVLRAWQHVPVSRVSLSQAEEGGLFGGFLLGASLGIVWLPCLGPILAAILSDVARDGTMIYGICMMVAYSLGLAIPMLAIAYSSNFLSGKVRSLAKHTLIVRRIAGVVLIVVGLYYLSGVTGISLPF
jgi:cytochrome c-type biogenesis protein